jgi:phytoene desaturase
MRVVVIGAGLGGLGAALRLQGAGHDVVVVEGRARPGGRAYQLRDDGYTWDTGPSLITMPWVLEETFAAGGLDLHSEVTLRRLDPFYRIRWAGEERTLDFVPAERMPEQIARFSPRDAAAFDGFLEALRPIYEEGILGAGRRPFLQMRDLLAFTPRMLRLGAALPLWQFVRRCARRSPSTRCSSAATRSASRRSTARSCTCSSSTACGTPTAASTRSSRRWRARSTCAAASASRGSSTAPAR